MSRRRSARPARRSATATRGRCNCWTRREAIRCSRSGGRRRGTGGARHLGGDPRAAAAPGDAGGLDLQLDAGIRSHRRRFGWEDGGFWLPECAYEPGLEGGSPPTGSSGSASTSRPTRSRSPRSVPSPPSGAGGAADRLGGDLLALGARRLSLRPGLRPVRRQIAARDAVWRIGGGAYDPAEAAAAARRQAGEFLGAIAARLRHYAEEREGAAWSSSRSTPSCSATGGRRGRSGWRRCWRVRPRPGCGSSPSPARSKSTSPSAVPCAAPAGARTRTSRPGTRLRSPTSPGRGGGWSCACCARSVPASPARAPNGRHASCSPPSPATGPSSTAAAGGRLRLAARRRSRRGALRGHRMDRDTDPRMRSLAPDMTLQPLLEP